MDRQVISAKKHLGTEYHGVVVGDRFYPVYGAVLGSSMNVRERNNKVEVERDVGWCALMLCFRV